MKNDMIMIVVFCLVVACFAIQHLHTRLRSIETKLNKLLALQGVDANALQEPSAEVLALAHSGKRIAAIKAYRQQTGAGLNEAKDVIEKYLSLPASEPNA